MSQYKDRTKAAGEVVSGKRLYLSANDTDMEAIQHYFKTVERGNPQVTIDLPEGIDQAEVEVIVRPLHRANIENGKPKRYNLAQRMKGTMSSDYDSNQYDVYDQ